MSSANFKTGSASRLGPASAVNQSFLLDKLNVRTSTPDSEALASSDDELDHRHEHNPAPPASKPTRRPSWLNDTSQPVAGPRKGSFASSMSPTGSHPSTPSGEPGNGHWPGHAPSAMLGRPSGAPTFPWGTGIWNADRKDAPQRLSEVLPSPTSTVSPSGGNASFFGNDGNGREINTTSQIPFAIPLHPTPKTYRSQSYSVGQQEADGATMVGMSSSAVLGRARHPALQHRPSRPSMLSEMSNDGSMLGKVKEVEDDDEDSTSSSLQGSFHQSSDAKTIELLARENAMLRQQQYNTARLRPRASTGASFLGSGYPSVPEESDYAIDEMEDGTEYAESLARRAATRRRSEYAAAAFRPNLGLDSRKDNISLNKAIWTSSPSFSLSDISQSRRHSFANMPTRQGSISSLADSTAVPEGSHTDLQGSYEYSTYSENHNPGVMPPFFPGAQSTASVQPQYNPYQTPYGLQSGFQNRATSPHRGHYGIAQARHNQPLYIVLFKCARADVFYIQEGTGLTVKPGDLVIVEADRGTDLGTVARDNVDWQSAKDLTKHYSEEQYKWLMMYSQNAAAAQESSGSGLLASATALQGSAVGGMGPATHSHMQEPNNGELRPKLIKRLAQSHEIHALRDKEGQEAKAKRVCMQKVKEHALNMEILDAEFQMDWKKLTFYYFADSYVNFNALVTDLFKIYKTRIWMSAINPASFASPTLGIQAPSGVGPGAVGIGRAGPNSEPRQVQQITEAAQPSYTPAPSAARGYRAPYTQPTGADRLPPGPVYATSNYSYGPVAGYAGIRANSAYVAMPSPGMDGFSGMGYQHPDFHATRQRFGNTHIGGDPTLRAEGSPMSPNEWTGGLQGLSLNSH